MVILRDRQYLLSNLYLDEDGELYWRATGKRACYVSGLYKRVQKNKTWEYAHHIIWCVVNGYWPEKDIDHKNGNGHDNRPDNIREATETQNMGNSSWGPMRGIEKHGKKFRARIGTGNGRIELGSYATVEEAQAAYRIGAEKYFGFEFAFHNRAA
jgi:hypothetical protein